MATFKNPLTVISGSGGGVTRPTTWAEFAAMTSTEMQQVYGVGDRVSIACPWVAPSDNKTYDLMWEIAAFGTTKKENDNTEYPCVTLVARLAAPGAYQFDAPETPTAATEETAQDGIYYFGYNGSTYTALNLSTGDTIPYGDYTAVYKTDVTNNLTDYNTIRQYGWNNYKRSAIRQWLNSDADANSWWQASHIGDAAPNYTNQKGFMSGFEAAFKNILQRTEVETAGNSVTDGGSIYKTYDYFFLLSLRELCESSGGSEGDKMPYFGTDDRTFGGGVRTRGQGNLSYSADWWLRTNNHASVTHVFYIMQSGSSRANGALNAYLVVPACKIILAGN